MCEFLIHTWTEWQIQRHCERSVFSSAMYVYRLDDDDDEIVTLYLGMKAFEILLY